MKAGLTEKAIKKLIQQVEGDTRIILANIDYYIAQAKSKGEIAKKVGKAMGQAGKYANNINQGATKTVEAVNKYQQKRNDIAARLNGGGSATSSLSGVINRPALKAW